MNFSVTSCGAMAFLRPSQLAASPPSLSTLRVGAFVWQKRSLQNGAAPVVKPHVYEFLLVGGMECREPLQNAHCNGRAEDHL